MVPSLPLASFFFLRPSFVYWATSADSDSGFELILLKVRFILYIHIYILLMCIIKCNNIWPLHSVNTVGCHSSCCDNMYIRNASTFSVLKTPTRRHGMNPKPQLSQTYVRGKTTPNNIKPTYRPKKRTNKKCLHGFSPFGNSSRDQRQKVKTVEWSESLKLPHTGNQHSSWA